VGGVRESMSDGLPFHLADYLDLVNWTGQAVRDDKRGAIADDLPPISERIGITRQAWLQLAKDFSRPPGWNANSSGPDPAISC